jgi:nitrite reductase/ring-hydroxylating ferredoxin subunit
MTDRVALGPGEVAAVREGQWVHVELGRWVPVGPPQWNARARSALVGRTHGKTLAWANVCRHQPLSLDVTADPVELAPGVRAAPMDDGRTRLMCHSHGALYRTSDGACVTGPCVGESLFPIDVEDAGGIAIALILR